MSYDGVDRLTLVYRDKDERAADNQPDEPRSPALEADALLSAPPGTPSL